MSDKIREEFEAWHKNCLQRAYGDEESYDSDFTNTAWLAWKASRSALSIDLPDPLVGARRYQNAESAFAHKEGIDECRSAIESYGLKVTP